jgi:hypothetical protein
MSRRLSSSLLVATGRGAALASEQYATQWHGLFPNYLISAFLFALVFSTVPFAIIQLLVLHGLLGASLESYLSDLNPLFYPIAPFLLFYLASRSRIDLGVSYVGVAVSIFVGAFAGAMPLYFLDGYLGAFPPNILETLVYVLGNALDEGFLLVFAGFAAVLLSYYRRM